MLSVKNKLTNRVFDAPNCTPVYAHQTFDSDGDPSLVIELKLSKEDMEDAASGKPLFLVFKGNQMTPWFASFESPYEEL